MKKRTGKKVDFSFFGKVFLATVAAASIIFIVAGSFSNVTFSNITGTVEAFFLNLKKGDGYPYECSAEGAKSTDTISSYLAVLDDTTVIFLNRTAKEVLRYDSTYTNPEMSISNGRALVFNRGSSAFSVTGQSDLLYETTDTEGKLDDSIITGTIGNNGSLAFGTWSDDGTSKFVTLNKKLGKEFYYNFKSDRVLTVALSDNGKYGACAVFGAENATYYSIVHIFDLNKTEPLQSLKLSGETVVNLEFLRNKTLSIVTDEKRRVVSVNDASEENLVDYSSHSLISFAFDEESKRSALCYSKYGSTSSVICAFYRNGKESCRIEGAENVKEVSCNKKYIAILTENQVLCYNYRGNLKSTIDLTFNVDSIELDSTGLYLFSGSNIYRTKVNKDTVLEAE